MTSNFFCSGFFGQIKGGRRNLKNFPFFSQFVTDFPQNWKEIRKTFVQAKSWVESLATFSLKKFFKKNSASWFFFEKSFEKTQIFRVFHLSSPISQNRDQIQGPWFRIIYKPFVGYIFAKKWRQSFFSDCAFWAKKGMKNFRIFFLICSSYFSTLTKDTETILPQDK